MRPQLEKPPKLSSVAAGGDLGMNDPAMNEPTPPPYNPPPASVPPTRAWDVACHLAAFAGYLTGIGLVAGPLIVWLLKRAEMPSVDAHGKESLNFHLSILIYGLVLTFGTCFIGWFLVIPLAIFQIVCTILAAIKASEGGFYRYPLTIRLVT